MSLWAVIFPQCSVRISAGSIKVPKAYRLEAVSRLIVSENLLPTLLPSMALALIKGALF